MATAWIIGILNGVIQIAGLAFRPFMFMIKLKLDIELLKVVIFYFHSWNISQRIHASVLFSFGLLLVDGFLRVQNFDDIWKRVVVMWTHLQLLCYQL